MSETKEVATKQLRVFPSDWSAVEKEIKAMGPRTTAADVIRKWRLAAKK